MTWPAFDRDLGLLVALVLALLVVATAVGLALGRRFAAGPRAATMANVNARIRAWWVMCAVYAAALAVGPTGSVCLFAVVSILALREFYTLVVTRRADHRTLFWSFFVITPLQYLLVATRWYGMFVILIPVYAFLFVPTRIALAADTESFLRRVAEIQWGLMVAVYCVSHAPALLMLPLAGGPAANARLLIFLLAVDQLSDVFQFLWGKLVGGRRIAPRLSPNKTWAGFLGGTASAVLVGTGLWWATPFRPLQAAAMSAVIALLGFAGGLVMSAIKRDRGVKDFGTLLEGHGGILDRIDSVCFAAPVFFHLTRYFFT
jgi:phosphatidate cytidylyltransferase